MKGKATVERTWMAHNVSRRRFLGTLGVIGGAAGAGCIGAPTEDESTQTEATDDETVTDEPRASPTVSGPSGTPESLLRQYVESTVAASDPAVVGAYFHPIHPFHPENIDPETAGPWLLRDEPVSQVAVETMDREVTTDLVRTSPFLQGDRADSETIEDALTGEEAAVVEVTITDSSGDTSEFSAVTVTHDGNWVILTQGVRIEADVSDPGPFDVRVVDKVTFNTDEDRARVHFVESPVADRVTAKAANATSSRSSSTPGVITYFDVNLDPTGDELVVTATVDGETRTIHREQYPESARVVEGITYDDDPDSDLFDATARVSFTGNQSGDRLTVSSTVHGGETMTEPAENATYSVVGIDPGGDEVVVTLTNDGTTAEVHRERYHQS